MNGAPGALQSRDRALLTVNDHFENRRFAAILGKQAVHERFRETLACLQRAESTKKENRERGFPLLPFMGRNILNRNKSNIDEIKML